MSVDVIGAGFGRTGTLSLKAALERLGFAPCHHMVEIINQPETAPLWYDAADGKPTDWQAVLGEYRAVVDWPGCHFWRELAAAFPQAKVLLTERDPEAWYKSMTQTIFEAMRASARIPAGERRTARGGMAYHIVMERTFGGNVDKDHVLSVYKAHNEAVKAALPKDRLLVYDVREGWAPLCEFLGVAVPDEDFPRSNSTEEFRARIEAARAQKR